MSKVIDIAVARKQEDKNDPSVDIATVRRDFEKFINCQEEQSDHNFLCFIEQRLRKLKNTASELTDDDTHMSEAFDHIYKILTYIQAIVEADKNSVSSVILRELKKDGMFKELLRETTENYADTNKKVIYLSKIVKDLTSKKVTSKEDIFQNIESIKKDLKSYSDLLYEKIDKKIDKIREDNVDSIEKLQQQYDDVVKIVQSEKDVIENDMKAFAPLVQDIIHTELDEKGTFIELLTNKIIQISNEKEGELQEKFKKIVEHIVGKGTEINPKIARENIIRGFRSLKDADVRENITRELNSLSEADVDEILGSKILKIVDKKSGFGDTFANIGNAIANVKNTINQYVAFGGQVDSAKGFFDGFSFSIYYYKVIPQENWVFVSPDDLLPIDLKHNNFDYISEFENISKNLDVCFKGYKHIKRNIPKIINQDNPLDICCFVRVIDSKRAYFVLSQEPSNYFKEQVDSILLKKYKNIADIEKSFGDLSENYKIPKVDFAIFNSSGFELPSDDGKSVVTSKTGEKYLNAENEQELLILLDDMRKFFDKKRSLFNKNKEYHSNKDAWYYWATSNKKYLAVKMLEPLSDKDREKFCGYVEKNIWNHLVNTRSLSEMQDWLNTFIQKDAGVLANNPTLFSKMRTVYNVLVFVSILLLFGMLGIYFRYPNWLLPDLRFGVHEIKQQNIAEYDEYKHELNRLKSKFDHKFKLLKSELSKKVLAKFELSDDCEEPFEFSKYSIDLSANDYIRLRRISKNLITLHNECKVVISTYDNIDKKLNLLRAEKIYYFLIKDGRVPQDSVSISNEVENDPLRRVSIVVGEECYADIH